MTSTQQTPQAVKSLSVLLKSWIPHFAIVALFLSINSLFFYPQFSGKQIGQDDIVESPGQSREVELALEDTGRRPLWTNNIYVGQPSFYTGFYFENPLWSIERVLQLFFGRPINVFFLSMLSTYLALLVLGITPWVAAIGGVGYGMATNNVILYQAGHMMKIGSLMYMPFIIAGLILLTRREYMKGFLFFTLGMAMTLLHHHVQMVYYLMLVLLILGLIYLIQWIKEGQYNLISKVIGIVLVGTLIGTGANLARMWTTYEFSDETIRGKNILENVAESSTESTVSNGLDWDYAMAWSNNTVDVLSGLIPGIAGGSSAERMKDGATYTALRRAGVAPQADGSYRLPIYWGALPFTSGPIYFGAVILLLFTLGMFLQKGPIKWWLGSAVLFTILLSYGKNQEWINRFLFDYFPLFSKFRTPNSVLSVTTILFPILAALGLIRWMELPHDTSDASKTSPKRKGSKKRVLQTANFAPLFYALVITAGFAAFIALAGPSLFSFQGMNDAAYAESGLLPYLLEDRRALMVGDAWRSFALILGAGLFLWGFAAGRLKKEWMLAGVFALVVVDFWGVNRRYIAPADFKESREQILEEYYVEREVDREIVRIESLDGQYDRGDYRVLDLSINTFNTNKTTYFHNTIGGYTAVKLQRIQDMIDVHLRRMNPAVLNMMNTTYIITQQGQLMVNDQALGWAWFVDDIQLVQSPREEIDALFAVDPARTAIVLESEFSRYLDGLNLEPNKLDPNKNSSQTEQSESAITPSITRTDYQLDSWTYSYNTPTEQLAVFSEMWYKPEKGLKAFVNGEPADFIRANYMLRAIRVPAGEGTIEFRYDPDSYRIGQPITLAMAWGLILMLLSGLGVTLRRQFKSENSAP